MVSINSSIESVCGVVLMGIRGVTALSIPLSLWRYPSSSRAVSARKSRQTSCLMPTKSLDRLNPRAGMGTYPLILLYR